MASRIADGLPEISESKNPVVGTAVLIERAVTPIGDRLRARGVFQAINQKNENNRIYPDGVWQKNLGDGSALRERLGGRMVLGELEHPESGTTHLARVSHRVDNAWIEDLTEGNPYQVPAGRYVLGEYTILNTPMGQILQELHAIKTPVGISSRGRGDTSPGEDGAEVVQDNYDCETWDCVYQPSVSHAYPAPVEAEPATEKLATEAKALLSATEDLSKKDFIELVETGSRVSGMVESLTKVSRSQEESIVMAALAERGKSIIQQLRERRNVAPDEPKREITEGKKHMAAERSNTVGQKELGLLTAMTRRCAIAEKRASLAGNKPKANESSNNGALEALKLRYDKAVELADSLLQRARREKSRADLAERKYNTALALGEALRERALRNGAPAAAVNEEEVETKVTTETKNKTGEKVRTEGKKSSATKQVVETKTAAPEGEVIDPAGKSSNKVQESTKPRTLMGDVVKRGF